MFNHALDEGATLLTSAFDPDDRFHALFRKRAMNRIEYRLGVKALRPGVPAEAQRRVHRAPDDPRREEREEIPAIPARAQVDEEHGHGEETQHESADRRNDAHGAAQGKGRARRRSRRFPPCCPRPGAKRRRRRR